MSEWKTHDLPLPAGTKKPWINVLRGSAADDVWLLCALSLDKERRQFRAAFHWDGKAWSVAEVPIKAALNVFPIGKHDVWTVGPQGTYAHFDGSGWTVSKIPDVDYDLIDVYAAGGHVYAAATGAWIYHFDGKTWHKLTPPELHGSSTHEVWGTSATNVLVPVNREKQPSQIARHNGRWWTTEAVGMGGIVLLGGTAPDDIWALSRRNQGFHYDGEKWTRHATSDNAQLYGLSVAARDEAWAVGENGVVLRWDGVAWRSRPSGTKERLLSVYAPPGGGPAWMAGDKLYRRG